MKSMSGGIVVAGVLGQSEVAELDSASEEVDVVVRFFFLQPQLIAAGEDDVGIFHQPVLVVDQCSWRAGELGKLIHRVVNNLRDSRNSPATRPSPSGCSTRAAG